MVIYVAVYTYMYIKTVYFLQLIEIVKIFTNICAYFTFKKAITCCQVFKTFWYCDLMVNRPCEQFHDLCMLHRVPTVYILTQMLQFVLAPLRKLK